MADELRLNDNKEQSIVIYFYVKCLRVKTDLFITNRSFLLARKEERFQFWRGCHQ